MVVPIQGNHWHQVAELSRLTVTVDLSETFNGSNILAITHRHVRKRTCGTYRVMSLEKKCTVRDRLRVSHCDKNFEA